MVKAKKGKMSTLLMQLLTADPTGTFITRLGDQLFTIVLLATISWLLWKRITKVQDRMDAYLSEDRKEMSEVIKNNTTVMEAVTDILKEIKRTRHE
jgi:hypothetical protein